MLVHTFSVYSFPALIELVDVTLESYVQSPASEPHLTNPEEDHEAITALKLAKLRALAVSRTGL
jgi:hypothetical protein